MNPFTEALGLPRYTLYMQDYGEPVGFRMVLAHPERAEALIVQDAVAHNEGPAANWKTRRAFWADRAANESALRTNLMSMATTRTRHVGSDPNVERYARISGPMNRPTTRNRIIHSYPWPARQNATSVVRRTAVFHQGSVNDRYVL